MDDIQEVKDSESGAIKRELVDTTSETAHSKKQRTEYQPRHIALAHSKFAEREAEVKDLERKGIIQYKVYRNDGKDESGRALIGLINIFSKQLPKMPKNYICRLVMDWNHSTLALLKDNEIIGGICYKSVSEQRFAEIAFCAVNSTEQVRGYGTIMMNELKDHVQKQGESIRCIAQVLSVYNTSFVCLCRCSYLSCVRYGCRRYRVFPYLC